MNIEEEIQQIILDNFQEKIRDISESIVRDFLDKKFSETDLLSDGKTAATIREYAGRYTSTEIGNRLRCGIYDHNIFKKVFDENFDEIMRKQIKSELTILVRDEIKVIVQDYLKEIMSKIM